MRILVVVANIQMRTLKTEVEKGSMRTAIGHGLAGPKRQLNCVYFVAFAACYAKGNQDNIPEPGRGYCTVTLMNSSTQAGAPGSVVFAS